MSVEELVQSGLKATSQIADDDLRDVLTHPDKAERQKALMRLVSSAFQRGWDDCFEEITAVLSRFDMAHLVESIDKRVH